ncbi:MAG: DUF1801 domain-containing protein [Phycisphaerales bacterium]|nr:DUF1801 domain-containing protein [Phycisphaerales bacterium]
MSPTPSPPRLPPRRLADHLVLESAATRRLVGALRRAVLRAAPSAAEAIKFRALCYYHADAWFGSIGGNICFIEVRRGRVSLSFIHGAALPDPDRLLRGKAKMKRFIPVVDLQSAADPRIAAIIHAAAELRPWD